MATTNRRRTRRSDYFAQVQVKKSNEVHIMSARNISRGGIFLRAEPDDLPELQPGRQVDLVLFRHPDALEGVSCQARVVRVEHDEASTESGFGLCFEELTPQASSALGEFLDEESQPDKDKPAPLQRTPPPRPGPQENS